MGRIPPMRIKWFMLYLPKGLTSASKRDACTNLGEVVDAKVDLG
jgi:hypothetical protein